MQLTIRARLRELLAASDAGDIETALRFYGPDYVDHDATEARHTVHDMIAEGDLVAARISVEARHTGALWGFAPSGRMLRNDSIVIYRFVDGQIRERWCRERWCRERRSTRSLLESHEV